MEDILPTEIMCPHCKRPFVIAGLAQEEDAIYCHCGHCNGKIMFAKVPHHELKATPVVKQSK